MFYGKSKRIIVIKDIHSNLFEEAILVLKEENTSEQKQDKGIKSAMDKQNNKNNDYIIKEAELIINNYIKDNKGLFTPSAQKDNNPKRKMLEKTINKPDFYKNLIINSALLGSIAAVIFLIIKLF